MSKTITVRLDDTLYQALLIFSNKRNLKPSVGLRVLLQSALEDDPNLAGFNEGYKAGQAFFFKALSKTVARLKNRDSL